MKNSTNLMITEEERRNRKKLFELMRENPELPVIPFVDTDVVASDDFGCWMGSWGEARIDAFLIPPQCEEPIIFRSSGSVFDTLEKMLDSTMYENLPDNYSSYQAYDALPWQKAIIVDICLPEINYGTKGE